MKPESPQRLYVSANTGEALLGVTLHEGVRSVVTAAIETTILWLLVHLPRGGRFPSAIVRRLWPGFRDA